MSSKTATLALKITGDARDGNRALDSAEGRLDGFGRKIAGLGAALGVGAAVTGIAMIGKAAFDAASEAEQATGGIEAVFGSMADTIENKATAAATAVGLSKTSYEQLAAVIGSQLKGAGMPIEEVTGKTQDLVTMGADLAATFGGTTADAVSALSSVLKGETDPIEAYGVSIKQSDISARLAATGQDKLTGTALKSATAQAALALVTEQTAAAHGQFAAQSNTAAEKSQVLSAWWDNLKAKAGEGLLPIFVTLVNFFSEKVGPAFDKLTAAGGPLATFFAQVGAFVTDQLVPALSSLWNELEPKLKPILETVGRVLRDDLVPAFKRVWDIVHDYVFPILKSVLGPALEGLKGAWDKLEAALDKNRDKFDKIYQNVQPLLTFLRDKVAPFVGGALKLAFEGLGKVIGPVVDTIAWLLDKASSIGGFIGKVGNLFGGSPAGTTRRGAPLLGAASGGGLFGAASSLGGGGVGPTAAAEGLITGGNTYVTINVSGALDRRGVADQIAELLAERGVRRGSTVAVRA